MIPPPTRASIPRAPSPNLGVGLGSAAAGPSRPSTSSNRSLRRTEADFEAALLDPKSTVFISAGPSTSFDRDTDSDRIEKLGPPAHLTLSSTASASSNGNGNGSLDYHHSRRRPSEAEVELDPDAPLPIEKRSFEEDLLELGRNRDGRAGLGIGLGFGSPVRGMQTPGVIPPTPSTQRHARRGSQMTTGSVTSGTSDTPSRRRASKSLGIDAELGELPKSKQHAMPAKRRSIFRSPGTASSPDLATLVRKAKEAKAVSPSPAPNSASQQQRRDTNPRPSSSAHQHQSSSAMASRYGAMLGGNQMASIAEGSGTVGSRQRTQTADEGFKSMRNKARGVFGKMFGSSRSDSSQPSTTPPSATTTRFPDDISDQPPVPPVPSAYALPKRRAPDPPPGTSAGGETVSRQRSLTASSTPAPRAASPAYDGRTSVTPTGDRRISNGSLLSADPTISVTREGDWSLRRAPSGNQKASGHVRQPASAAYDDSPPRIEKSLRPVPSPATQTVHNFTADVAGMLAGIGQTEPARELGLPPDSLRSQKDRTASMETARATRKKVHPELGRSASVQDTSKAHLSPVPAQRTSSLPYGANGPSKPSGPSTTPKRTASSPNPSLNEATLMPAAQAISRSSSRSSGKKSDDKPSLSRSPSLLSRKKSLILDRKKSMDDNSPLIPTSVRLVSSPRLEHAVSPLNLAGEGLTQTSLIGTSPWGKQTPRTMSAPAGRLDDQLEVVSSPPETPKTQHEEDEEEKGRRLACEFLENDSTHIPTDKVAEFLGGPRAVNAIALRYYMQYFDMKGQTLVESFRDLCQKLHLKAESQEIDRIIEAFSARYFECNPTTVYGTPGVVHTVTAAMLMLNTDLHIAELNKHMSRNDFVRNAMRAIHESMPAVDRSSTPDLVRDDDGSAKVGFGSSASTAPSFVSMRTKTSVNPPSTQRSASAPVVAHPHPPSRTESVSSIGTNGFEGKTRSSSTTVSSFNYTKSWEMDAEAALKDIYSSVKADRILLPISGQGNRQSMMSISSNGPYDRARTVRSPSDRVNALKRGSIRGMQGLLNNPYGSLWSASDGRLSPTPSYATSINEGLGSFAPTLGFASNLSHTVIREHDDELRSIDSQVSDSDAEDMDDDELALLGAPWAKEGLLSRKLYWETVGKRAKKNEWKQFFVVISKGDLFMFTFGEKGGGGFGGGSVGGGNWLENANANGTISLMHTMAVALPKPGYNANRPYCFSLASPNGETSFFQAGTEDLVAEWVATCNYWAARKSRQPLQGGVSNMEYGWNRASEPDNDQDDRASVKSGRSNLSKLGGTYGRRTAAGMNDRIYINEWKPPPPATMPSPLDEESQLEALQTYVRSLVDELEQHKAVEEPMNRLYTTGSKNLAKARDNWKAKSHYIHTEIYKYETYVEALRNAISLRVKKQGEKKLEKSLARSLTSLHHHEEEEGEEEEDEGVYHEASLQSRVGSGTPHNAMSNDNDRTIRR
ncbi:hypothetical protein I316_00884 [Kwoniella heveanensis BCC8398]|uniref:SEC7 domain-containing protein n=1 Tax=Kwoniella heveanensis BCC8398 TaxID=1296120 RepID=A0A1B9H3B7_9TREE|nr:hypothetical protein I316_00884 [Kwoniella heveanensis BCC8398]